jgi:hypothetical protein
MLAARGISSLSKGRGMEIPKNAKPFALGAVVGAVLLGWIGFDALGWKTSSTSENLGKRQAESAVVAAHARICAAHFNEAKNLPARLAELTKADQWARGELVAKAGFATMAGDKEPIHGVSQACADLVVPKKT